MKPAAASRAIEAWFSGNRRVLPWRTRRTAWRSLVSEFMLQQTQVANRKWLDHTSTLLLNVKELLRLATYPTHNLVQSTCQS